MKSKYFLFLFFIFGFADVLFIYLGETGWHSMLKPLLMPTLMLSLLFEKMKIKWSQLIIAALFFSFCGDVFLLNDVGNNGFFIYGLLCFLITHILYIIYFHKIKKNDQSLLQKYPWIAALVAAFAVSLIQFLYPQLGALKIPVIIYASVICLMLLYSLHVFLDVNAPANWMFVVGAIFFVCSDSLLAINKFNNPFALAGSAVMFTYCTAQFFIVTAVFKRIDSDKNHH